MICEWYVMEFFLVLNISLCTLLDRPEIAKINVVFYDAPPILWIVQYEVGHSFLEYFGV